MLEQPVPWTLGPQQARVYLALRRLIETRQLQPGQRLDSQARLAQQHGVALATLHQVIRVLEQEGYVVSRQGVGTFVADTPPQAADPLRALARFTSSEYASSAEMIDSALSLLARQVGVRSSFVSRFDGDQLVILADYDQGGCGIKAGAVFPLEDAF
jgi:DNA-binding GntR family transcriptional regulator